MDVYTQKMLDGTFVVVTRSDPFDTLKAAKREELKRAIRRVGAADVPAPGGTCDKCKRTGVLVAEYSALSDHTRDPYTASYICHECIAAAVRRRIVLTAPTPPFKCGGKQNLVEP
jgi:hypothetical protein